MVKRLQCMLLCSPVTKITECENHIINPIMTNFIFSSIKSNDTRITNGSVRANNSVGIVKTMRISFHCRRIKPRRNHQVLKSTRRSSPRSMITHFESDSSLMNTWPNRMTHSYQKMHAYNVKTKIEIRTVYTFRCPQSQRLIITHCEPFSVVLFALMTKYWTGGIYHTSYELFTEHGSHKVVSNRP